MNKKLFDLYNRNWENLCKGFRPILKDKLLHIKPANPLLIKIKDEEEYKNSDLKIMVFNTETKGWCGKFRNDINKPLMKYDRIFNQNLYIELADDFFDCLNILHYTIQEKYPDKKISIVWNNLIKTGKSDENGMPPDYIYEEELKNFNVLYDEIKILKPTAVIFLTGPNYDSIIKEKFNNAKMEAIALPFTFREFANVEITGVPFAFRTYSASYLFSKESDIYFNALAEKINIYSERNFHGKTHNDLLESLHKAKVDKCKAINNQQYEEAANMRDREKYLEDAIKFLKE